jgi:hypothetical protein
MKNENKKSLMWGILLMKMMYNESQEPVPYASTSMGKRSVSVPLLMAESLGALSVEGFPFSWVL